MRIVGWKDYKVHKTNCKYYDNFFKMCKLKQILVKEESCDECENYIGDRKNDKT